MCVALLDVHVYSYQVTVLWAEGVHDGHCNLFIYGVTNTCQI